MSNILVSIIVNNYNYASYLQETVESALNQSYSHIEVIVVDDGSTDNSWEIIEGFGDRVIKVYKENGGQGSAFNAGFSISKGLLIIFLDADDYLYPNTVEKIVSTFGHCLDKLAKIAYRLDCVNARGVKLGGTIPHQKSYLPQGCLKEKLLRWGTEDLLSPPTSGNAFPKNALEKVMPVPEELFTICADNWLFRTVPFFGELVNMNVPLGAYRIHGKNNFYGKRVNNIQEYLERKQEILQEVSILLKKKRIHVNCDQWRSPSLELRKMVADRIIFKVPFYKSMWNSWKTIMDP